jgi:hypothetical protein
MNIIFIICRLTTPEMFGKRLAAAPVIGYESDSSNDESEPEIAPPDTGFTENDLPENELINSNASARVREGLATMQDLMESSLNPSTTKAYKVCKIPIRANYLI